MWLELLLWYKIRQREETVVVILKGFEQNLNWIISWLVLAEVELDLGRTKHGGKNYHEYVNRFKFQVNESYDQITSLVYKF